MTHGEGQQRNTEYGERTEESEDMDAKRERKREREREEGGKRRSWDGTVNRLVSIHPPLILDSCMVTIEIRCALCRT